MTPLVALLLAPALAEPPAPSPDAWEDRGSRRTDMGEVQVSVQQLPEAYCVRASAVTPHPVEALLSVATDLPSAPSWSTQDLVVSEVLQRDADAVHYWQYLDVPNWMLVADRYWVTEGVTTRGPDGAARFTWTQLAADAHPAVDASAHARSDAAMRIPVTVGAWSFVPAPGGVRASYMNCADPGGKLPDWVVRFAATRTVPDNLADLVREVTRRAGG